MMNEPRCVHRHTILTHPNCFRKGLIKRDWWDGKTVAYLDIESSNLNANFGMMLTWCLKYKGDRKIRYGSITKKEIFDFTFDKRILKELLDELKNVDILVTYYGTGFDIPFLRARALFWGLSFPKYGSIAHWDLYFKVRSQFAIKSKSLASITNFLNINGKTQLDPKIWFLAQYGDPKSLNEVLDHNKHDVIILEELHKRIGDFSKWIQRSL